VPVHHSFGYPLAMEHFNDYVLSRPVIELLAVLFWMTGLIVFLTGMCLLISDGATLRYLERLNRRVFAQRLGTPMADTPEVRCIEQRHLRWIGLAFIAGAAYALQGLITSIDTAALLQFFNVEARFFDIAFWAIEGIRWALIAGNGFAIVAGLMLSIFPKAFYLLGARGVSQVSIQLEAHGPENKHFTLDGWVSKNPQVVGWIIIVAGLVPMGDLGAMLYGIR